MSFRKALNTYIVSPEKHGPSIKYFDDKFVILYDAYSKAQVHYLVMPRDRETSKLHPFEAFSGSESYGLAKHYVDMAIGFAEKELRELTGSHYDNDEYYGEFIQSGVHSIPSMDNAHIHVISKDMCSDRLKKPAHYISFTSQFFVPFEEIPNLPEQDIRRDTDKMTNLVNKSHLICWKCGKDFVRSFARLKPHLLEECTQIYYTS